MCFAQIYNRIEREGEEMGTTMMTSSTKSVFVYGSLLADEVVQILLNRVPRSSPATLKDYHRFSIKGRVYPAILPVQSKTVAGKILIDVTAPELDILDAFEDVEYQRRTVQVYLKDGGEKVLAETYVWCDANDPDLYGEWDLEEWKKLHMKDFTKMTNGFMEELELPEGQPRVATYESYYGQLQDNDASIPNRP